MYTLWLGTESSLRDYRDRQVKLEAALYSGKEAPNPELFQLHGNVGVIDVAGPLVNTESWFNDLVGLTSYQRIRSGLIEAAAHPEVERIVLNIDSGGGTPLGLPEAIDLVKRINAAVPVTAFTGGMMASAVYALGSAASQVYAAETATVGSIGVIATMLDRTELFKKEGINPVVVRSGSKKALANPFEPVTEEVKADLQAKTDYLYDWFTDLVQTNRGFTSAQLSAAADGQEFIGMQAVDVGLVDGITTLDALVGGLQTLINSTRKDPDMAKKRLLTEAHIALIAEGVPVEHALETPTEPAAGVTPPSEPETPSAPEGDPPTEPQAQAPAPVTELTAYLREELATKSAEILQLNMAVADLKRELSGYQAHHEGMRKVVMASVNRMEIGLKRPATNLTHLSDEALLAFHADTNASFCQHYPAGGKVKLEAEDGPPGVAAAEGGALVEAQLRAAKIGK